MGYGYRTVATLSLDNGDSTNSKDVDSWEDYVEDRPLANMWWASGTLPQKEMRKRAIHMYLLFVPPYSLTS